MNPDRSPSPEQRYANHMETHQSFIYLRQALPNPHISTGAALDLEINEIDHGELSQLESEIANCRTSEAADVELQPRTTPLVKICEGKIGVYYARVGLFANYAHRFIVGPGAEINYHCSPFNANNPVILQQILDIDGIEGIAENDQAREEIVWLSKRLSDVGPNSWQSR